MRHFRFIALGSIILGTVLGISHQAIAAEQIVLKYGPLERSIAVSDLDAFATTGTTSPDLQTYLRQAGQDPEEVRRTLNQSTAVNVRDLDRVLNGPLGDLALDQISHSVHTSSHRADRQALRSALVLSASDDNRISIMEVVRNYPTQQVYIDGNQLVSTYGEISTISHQIGSLLEEIKNF